jgi:hypothetical protein
LGSFFHDDHGVNVAVPVTVASREDEAVEEGDRPTPTIATAAKTMTGLLRPAAMWTKPLILPDRSEALSPRPGNV